MMSYHSFKLSVRLLFTSLGNVLPVKRHGVFKLARLINLFPIDCFKELFIRQLSDVEARRTLIVFELLEVVPPQLHME